MRNAAPTVFGAVFPGRHGLRAALLLLISGLLASGCGTRAAITESVAPEATLHTLVERMGERLALMPSVAEWKRANGVAVRDRDRERMVLEAAVARVAEAAEQARRPGFSEVAVRDFYQAQIDAAVAIQESILGRPPMAKIDPPDLHTVIRPDLDRLGREIADLLVALEGVPDRQGLLLHAERSWQIEGLHAEARASLVAALVALVEAPRISPRPRADAGGDAP